MYLKYKVISPEIAFVRCDVEKFEHCNGRLRHPHCAVWRSNSLAVNYQQMFNSLIVKQSNTITGNSHLSKLNINLRPLSLAPLLTNFNHIIIQFLNIVHSFITTIITK